MDNNTSVNKSISYKQAGVDIAAGNNLVERIKPFTKATNRPGSDANLGGFGGLFDLAACKFTDPVLVSSTDGVGTKLKLAFALNNHNSIGIDLVAMCVNDIVVQGAEPLFFLDYFATGKLMVDTASQVIKGIADGCKTAGCALIGGETAEMPGMYQTGHYDLAGFCVGAVERTGILPRNVTERDIILGIASSGIHSNGYSLVHHLLDKNNINLNDPVPFASNTSIGEILLKPTTIYVKPCLAIKNKVSAFAHITGGGLTENIPRILPDNLCAHIELAKLPSVELFNWLKKLGDIEDKEMLKTFNCGIGMVVIVPEKNVSEVITMLESLGEKTFEIGVVKGGNEKLVYV